MNEFHFTRREVLRIGSLSIAAPIAYAAADDSSRSTTRVLDTTASCIFIFLQGGPSHIDLWDPKPLAPREVRGEFASVATALPGVGFSELLPELSRSADQFALIRSMTHEFNNHIAGTYIMHTGSHDQPNVDREASQQDHPGPGAALAALLDSNSNVPVSVSLPNWLSIPGPSNRMPGQYGGVIGRTFDPFLIEGNPHDENFQPLCLTLPEALNEGRVNSRLSLLEQLDGSQRELDRRATSAWTQKHELALNLLTNPAVRDALDLSKVSPEVRDRYGRSKLGQSLLLARRLVEAGVKFVSVNEFNQTWDHHANLGESLKTQTAGLDRGVSTLLTDLSQNGLLDSTLVTLTGEFGRAPKINSDGGRDHWPQVYSTLLAGADIRGGIVVGSSDRQGGEVADKPVHPQDFLATLWTALGLNPRLTLNTSLGRPVLLSHGQPLSELF